MGQRRTSCKLSRLTNTSRRPVALLTCRQSLVSLIGPSSSLIGGDAAVHLAEELKDAAYVLPRAMVTSAVFNYVTQFVMVISFVSAIGNNLNKVLAADTNQPWVTVVYLVTGFVYSPQHLSPPKAS